MVAPYTAVDLIRVMDHEMHHRHEEAARRRSWFRRGNGPTGGEHSHARPDTGPERSRRPDRGAFFSLFSKPAA